MQDFLENVIDDISIKDLMNGYLYDSEERLFICILCGKVYEEDIIYKSNSINNLILAHKAIKEHIIFEHGGVFNYLISLDRSYTGLTDRQKEIFKIIFEEEDNKIIAEKMDTTPATVRSYRFKKRERIRQSKVFLAIGYLLLESNDREPRGTIEEISKIAISKREKERKISENFKNNEDSEKLEFIDNLLGKKNLNK